MSRSKEIKISEEFLVTQQIEPGKVMVLVLDGIQGKAKLCEAVEHGQTIIETAKGKAARILFHEGELF